MGEREDRAARLLGEDFPVENARQLLAAAVDEYSYKPGWEFIVEIGYNEAYIQCLRAEPNSCREGHPPISLVTTRAIPLRVVRLLRTDPHQFAPILRATMTDLVTYAELHERDEWLRKNGMRLTTPHDNRGFSIPPQAASTPESLRAVNDSGLLGS